MISGQHLHGRALAVCAAGVPAVTGIVACGSDGDDAPSPSSKRLNIELGAFADKMATIAPLQVVPVGNGHVAAVGPNVNGPGVAMLYVSSQTLTPAQISDLAGGFARQLD
ncbi:hypothetical protein [Embleya sp. NPDC001921]